MAPASHDVLLASAGSAPRPLLGNTVRVSERALSLAGVAVVVVATALGLWLRLHGLPGADGTLSIDEARLALASRGILEHGLPQLPSGWIYTRGLLSSYPVTLAFALLGTSDFAVRLPSILTGTALVPTIYLLGRQLAGRGGGLFAALFVAQYPPLVVWSRQAWLYAPYVLVYALALLFIVRAHQSGRARDQLLAGALVGLSFFAHELGVFLLIPLAAQVAVRLACAARQTRQTGARDRPAVSPLAPLAALGLAVGSLGLLWLLVTALRAETLVGSHGELTEYFSPRLDGAPFRFYGRMLLDGRGLLLALATLGIPLALAQRRYVVLLLWLALLPPFVHAAAIIPDQPQERYGLTLVVALVLLAAQSARAWAAWLANRRTLPLSSGALAGAVLALTLLVHQDLRRGLERGELPPRGGAWLQEARGLGIGPADLVMSDLPTVAGWYLGDLDYWVSSEQYQKYALQTGELRRDVHTGARLVRNVGEFQRLVVEPNRGRTLWVFASGRSYQWGELVDDSLKTFLERSAQRRIAPGDGSRILRIDL
ncbi:MAG: glycosyltransferase family 39 protein [Chloroflexi bacterium]|nr:glycosyltransferase family 39 protein [Chloroflexota bacterium]